MPELRDFQREDVEAVVRLHEKHQCVIGRAATGLGKAVELAALAQHYTRSGRVMILVDVEKLVRQLAETVQWFTGEQPGIEMGEQRSNNGGFFVEPDRVVVSTVQTQYSDGRRGPGKERYRNFDPREFSALLLDECELFLAPAARQVVEYYRSGNPQLRVFGCTATPVRTDGIKMGELFREVAFDRSIIWGIENGWLVPARQAFVRVSLDFASLKVRENEEGEEDYSAEEIAERINNEQTLVELAQGIIRVAGDRKSIIVCPDVASAKAVADYLDGERPGCARVVYGEMDPLAKDDVMNAHKRGEFQFLSSVMMLTKGYDDPAVSAIFNCRKTKSRRLYTQILGRGTRPERGLLDGIDDPAERREAILFSSKPNMLMVNMVGVEDFVRDITIIDILGEHATDRVRERAKRIMSEAADEAPADDPDAFIAKAKQQIEAEDEDRRQRRATSIGAEVEIDYTDDISVGTATDTGNDRIPLRTLTVLRNNKVPEDVISGMNAVEAGELARKIFARRKDGLCSYAQAAVLRRAGYSQEETRHMKHEQASVAIERCKQNGWRRPKDDNFVAAALELGAV